ncbi:MAG TPA: hypothetical protein VFU22_12040 [Roseiflexaceae bacterium]|nr:hypothetical protein [Roseiflexaceae bacterium]
MLHVYRPSNRISATGIFFLLLAVLCGGLAFGGLAFALSRLVWLIVLFPIGLGIAAGAILSGVITRQRVRNPALAAASGLLMALVIYGTLNYGGYLSFQSEMRKAASEEGVLAADAQDALINMVLASETGSTGFFGYLRLMAQEGVSIGRVGSSNQATLPEPLTWAYWLIELGIIGVIAALAAREAAKKPFCETCQQWYSGGTHVGSAADAAKEQLLGAARSGSFRQVGQSLSRQSVGSPSLEVYIAHCRAEQDHPSILTIRHSSLDSKGKLQFKDLLTAMIAPHEVAGLQRGLSEQNEAAAPERPEHELVGV